MFTVLFVTLGPLNSLGPFAQLSHDLDEPTLRTITVRSLQILGAGVGVLQVALAVAMIVRGLRGIGVLHP